MVKQKTDLEKEVDVLTENWVAVSQKEDGVAYEAWYEWRWREMRSQIQPDYFTVPSIFPPTTVAGAQAYFDVVRKIRKCIGWRTSRSILRKDPSAWMGEI